MDTGWNQFKQHYPREEDYPILIYTEEEDSFSYERSGHQKIWPRKWCVREDLYWKSVNPIRLPEREW